MLLFLRYFPTYSRAWYTTFGKISIFFCQINWILALWDATTPQLPNGVRVTCNAATLFSGVMNITFEKYYVSWKLIKKVRLILLQDNLQRRLQNKQMTRALRSSMSRFLPSRSDAVKKFTILRNQSWKIWVCPRL